MEKGRNVDLQPLVDAIVRRRMVEPSIFMLEMCKPLVGCMREFYSVSEPLMNVVFGSTLAPVVKRALQSSEETEILIQALERSRQAPRSTASEQVR